MVQFTTTILQFEKQGEKTGWTYIDVPADIAQKIYPGNKKAFRVKGKLDDHKISGMALLPMGGGNFILTLNASVRKAIHKRKGAMLKVQLELDKKPQKIAPELLECLSDEPAALEYFNSLAPSHKLYFSKWVESVKSEEIKTKRITLSVNALAKRWGFSQMMHAMRQDKENLK